MLERWVASLRMSAGRESGRSWEVVLAGSSWDFSVVVRASEGCVVEDGFGDEGGLSWEMLRPRVRLRRSEKPFVAVALAVVYSCWAEA